MRRSGNQGDFGIAWVDVEPGKHVLGCRELLDHVIVINERHLKRLLSSYLDYYHPWRTHQSLGYDAPDGRRVRLGKPGQIFELPIVGF